MKHVNGDFCFWFNDGTNEHLKCLNVSIIKIVIFCAAFRNAANAPLHANFSVFGSPICTLRSGEVDIKRMKMSWDCFSLTNNSTVKRSNRHNEFSFVLYFFNCFCHSELELGVMSVWIQHGSKSICERSRNDGDKGDSSVRYHPTYEHATRQLSVRLRSAFDNTTRQFANVLQQHRNWLWEKEASCLRETFQ